MGASNSEDPKQRTDVKSFLADADDELAMPELIEETDSDEEEEGKGMLDSNNKPYHALPVLPALQQGQPWIRLHCLAHSVNMSMRDVDNSENTLQVLIPDSFL